MNTVVTQAPKRPSNVNLAHASLTLAGVLFTAERAVGETTPEQAAQARPPTSHTMHIAHDVGKKAELIAIGCEILLSRTNLLRPARLEADISHVNEALSIGRVDLAEEALTVAELNQSFTYRAVHSERLKWASLVLLAALASPWLSISREKIPGILKGVIAGGAGAIAANSGASLLSAGMLDPSSPCVLGFLFGTLSYAASSLMQHIRANPK